MLDREKLVQRATAGVRETKSLDFKSTFDPGVTGDWCELIKDIVAFSNSGGGAIVFGLNEDLTPAGIDPAPILAIDPAVITNKIAKYTNYQFGEFEWEAIERDGTALAALIVFGVRVPMVFDKPGTYEFEPGRQKTAFSKGTIYFRHGSKSEPANMDDLRQWLDRELDRVREGWLGNIRRVVESPLGQQIRVISSDDPDRATLLARIVNDPEAAPFRPDNAQQYWPHRESGLVAELRQRLPEDVVFNGYDVQCVKQQHGIDPDRRPEFVFRPHEFASYQYSDAFKDWLLARYDENPNFFIEARAFRRAQN